jgi:hypothetical protein
MINNQGEFVEADVQKLFGIKGLSTVVVKGTAKRDKEGNLTVLATGVYVQKNEADEP